MEELKLQLTQIVNKHLAVKGFDLVDIAINGRRHSPVLKFFIDKEGGITLKDCIQLDRLISDLLDEEDLRFENYRLEVSSPGIDRPLRTEKDFRRNIGKQLIVQFTNGPDQKSEEGMLRNVDNGKLILETTNGRETLSFDTIIKAKVKIKL